MAGELGKSLYTLYRPKNMEEYCGEHIKDIVHKRFRKREDMPHVMLIHGGSGMGKTTFSRIIAKYYLCTNFTENGPCEQCEMCQSINEILIDGNSTEVECPGVTELDATIMNGKEAIQEVLDEALQTPIYSDYKVLIVDEAHQISSSGQNSMLKIIEDIPKHLVVIFATTNPEKILATIKSRCQLTLEVKKQTVKDMANRLEQISMSEGFTVSREALEIIAKKGDRAPRACINLLESIAKTYDGQITVENVKKSVGGVDSEIYMEYFKAANQSLESILLLIKKLKEKSVKLSDFVKGLMGFVMDSMYIKHGISFEDYTSEYIDGVKKLFEMYDSNDFDMLMQIIESLSYQITEDNDAKNEMLLTLTAMRISKIQLLANGLANEQSEAIKENKISLFEHSQKLKSNNEEIAEQLKLELTPNEIKESFGDIRQVVNTQNLLDTIKLPPLEATSISDDSNNNKNVSLGAEVDDFFNN